MTPLVHGGPDDGPPIRFDFSSNANPFGPPEAVLKAVLAVDRQRYPEPSYRVLREQLAHWHGLEAERILPASGGSEAIRRLTAAASRAGLRHVWVPEPGFADYAAAAAALGLKVHRYGGAHALALGLQADADGLPLASPALVWVCDPCNPTGTSLDAADWATLHRAVQDSGSQLAIDQAYEPLRLQGRSALPASMASQAWRLQCPNKALALTGVRAAYLLAPEADSMLLQPTQDLAPSWVLAAEGVALLSAWAQAEVQVELQQHREALRGLRQRQDAALRALGWQTLAGAPASVTPFRLWRPPQDTATLLPALRERGIKLRDASSFGLPGAVRLSTQLPAAQDALLHALNEITS